MTALPSFSRHLAVMAIVNRTPDSFYDSGRTFADDSAMAAVDAAVAVGAEIVDIGGGDSTLVDAVLGVPPAPPDPPPAGSSCPWRTRPEAPGSAGPGPDLCPRLRPPAR